MGEAVWFVALGCAAALCAWHVQALDGAWVVATARRVLHNEARLIARLVPGHGNGSRPSERATLGEVSEMVDVIRLGLTAGLSFDAALALYCEHRPGALSACMAQARFSWQMGMASREESLLGVARQLGVRQLESFATAVGQAHELGAPLADTLARQSVEMRAAHRAAVEREIERAPVKMVVPTGALILPALLLSIIGPLLASSGMF